MTSTGLDWRKSLIPNDSVPETLQVSLAHATYPIRIIPEVGPCIGELRADLEKQGRRGVLLTDAVIDSALAEFVTNSFGVMPKLVLPAGEKSKSLEHLGTVLDFMAANQLDRSSVLWVLGGGVMGDLGGFAASCYLRGIEFVQVPTTLLAMVDSSVGGKTGINLTAGKNLVGAFHQPRAVLIGTGLLATLPAREYAAGMAEIIKYGLLGDKALFRQLASAPLGVRDAALPGVIRRCCELKAAVVQADERETAPEGGRALLNLGHTFAHAIEKVAGFGVYLHGEAVAIGLVGAARLSQRLGRIGPEDVKQVEATLTLHSLPVRLREPLALAHLQDAMRQDKKVRAGRLRFVILSRLGEARTQGDIDPALVAEVWQELGAGR